MGLASGYEGLLHPEVDLQAATAKPAAAAGRQHRRLVQLAHAQQVTPETSAGVLTAWWDRELYVMDGEQRERVGPGHGQGSSAVSRQQ